MVAAVMADNGSRNASDAHTDALKPGGAGIKQRHKRKLKFPRPINAVSMRHNSHSS